MSSKRRLPPRSASPGIPSSRPATPNTHYALPRGCLLLQPQRTPALSRDSGRPARHPRAERPLPCFVAAGKGALCLGGRWVRSAPAPAPGKGRAAAGLGLRLERVSAAPRAPQSAEQPSLPQRPAGARRGQTRRPGPARLSSARRRRCALGRGADALAAWAPARSPRVGQRRRRQLCQECESFRFPLGIKANHK